MLKHYSILRAIAMTIAVCACSTKGNEKTEAPGHTTEFAVAEDKEALQAYYQLEHIKEWYPERILPPQFDYSIDLSARTPAELWLLRNEIFARNGYLFEDAVLRGHFNEYKWYQPIFDVPEFKVVLNKEEQDFVNRVLAREQELAPGRYVKQGAFDMIAYDHIYNTIQFKEIPATLREALVNKNFAIVPAEHEQLYHVYENNHYEYVPNFITTDLYLQLLHKHFSSTLQSVEEKYFIPLMRDLLKGSYDQSMLLAKNSTDQDFKKAAGWAATYLAVGASLLDSTEMVVPEGFKDLYEDELQKTTEASGRGSAFLGSRLIVYNDFIPRGNYTKSTELMRYFRCIKWLNSAPIYIDSDSHLLSAFLLAASIKRSPEQFAAFKRFNEAVAFIVGDEDNFSLSSLITNTTDQDAQNPEQFSSGEKVLELRKKIPSVTAGRVRGKAANAEAAEELNRPSIFFTAARYTFDAEIMIRLVHVLDPSPKRKFPKALDVFAVFGNSVSENILLRDYNEKKSWPAYADSLLKLKKEFSSYADWNRNIYTKTFETLNAVNDVKENYPFYTKTPAWGKRNLLASLGAWTELKHDMLLYAARPNVAEAGEGGGPPPPKHIGYVEPNIKFWEKALELLELQSNVLTKMNLVEEDNMTMNNSLKDMATFLLKVSRMELAHEKVSDEDFDRLSWLGGEIESLTLRIVKSDYLSEHERHVAVVADVYSYKSLVLEEAVGAADEIYVVAEINGKPYLTKGAVFSYYEFQSEKPLTDEAWREMIRNGSIPQRPTWLNEITIDVSPLESKPTYSF